MQHLTDQELQRRHKLEELEKLGIEAYPSELYDVTFHAKEITTTTTLNSTISRKCAWLGG